MHVWKNKDVTGADKPVQVVTYGGLGDPVSPSQSNCGFTKEANIVETYGTFPVLNIFYALTKDDRFLDLLNDYTNLTLPPYFQNGWPSMPASESINKLMMNSGVPISYLKKSPDHYIPQIYTHVDYDDPSDLHDLYGNASRFFYTDEQIKSVPLVIGTSLPLAQCEGDCDSDNDCDEELVCFKRDGKTEVPGCVSGGSGDIFYFSYCVQIETL